MLVIELAQMGMSLRTAVASLADVLEIVRYIQEPTGLEIRMGERQTGAAATGLLEVLPHKASYMAEILVGPHPDANMLLPLRVAGFNRRWTVGLWQIAGFRTSTAITAHYGNGTGRYSELGLDDYNATHVPLYTGRAPHGRTHVRVGHPVVATGLGADQLFIQVTHLLIPGPSGGGTATVFHVAVNNPTDNFVTATLASSFAEAKLPTQNVCLAPGEHMVLQ